MQKVFTVKVDSHSTVPDGTEIGGLSELKQYLLTKRAEDIARNVVRRLVGYALGRRLSYRDRPSIERIVEASKANDYRLRDLMVSICQSDLLLERERHE